MRMMLVVLSAAVVAACGPPPPAHGESCQQYLAGGGLCSDDKTDMFVCERGRGGVQTWAAQSCPAGCSEECGGQYGRVCCE